MVKVVTIGGGSSYTPELIEGFIKRSDRFKIDELWLVDVEEGMEKLEIVGNLARRMFQKAGLDTKVFLTLDRKEALKDANFVTTQFRVGQLAARAIDERIPNSHKLLGQETNGFGGMFKAFRTVPIILDIVSEVEELCPDAFIINFTNPAGIVSEAVNRYTNFKRFIGVCNVPIDMKFGVADMLEIERDRVEIDFLGLNHMVYGLDVYIDGENKTKEVVEKSLEHSRSVKNIHDVPFEPNFIKELNLLPCPYHRYFYKYNPMLELQLEEFKNGETRAEQVIEVEKELFRKYADENLDVKPKELEQRGGAYYSDVACYVITSIYNNEGKIHTVDIKNNGHVKNLEADDTLEITCRITRNGAVPLERINYLPREVKGLYELFKSYELKVCEAIIEKSYSKALLAANLSPFTRDDVINKQILDEMLKLHSKYVKLK